MKNIVAVSLLFMMLSVSAAAETPAAKLPPIKRQPNAEAVVAEHLAALNKCDYGRLMALYPPNVHLFLPGGKVIDGREQTAAVYRVSVKPFKDGGACGLKFEAEKTFKVGDTVNVQWKATADFLAEPYRGADAYVTKDGLMWAQVTTYDHAQIKAK
jgi:hypothetical protein